MSTFVRAFLETEVTVIPQIMDRYFGKYYNNALYNGVTWMVFILHIVHFVFDLSINALLKKMHFKEYVRIRLRKSLWYFGFYTCSFCYCFATQFNHNFEQQFLHHKLQLLDLGDPISGNFILGYVLLCSFFVSSFMWEGLQCSISSFTYLFLTGFVAFTYFLRYIELTIIIAGHLSGVHMFSEFARCLFCVMRKDFRFNNFAVRFTFGTSILTAVLVYFVYVPVNYTLPLARGFLKHPNSVILAGLNVTLWGWLICEIYSSALYRLIQHRWHRYDNEKVPECLGSKMECALFLPRDDVAYNLNIIREEIKEREARMMALRKPKKGANMLVQTLKCVAAINRKIKYRKFLQKCSTSRFGGVSDNVPDEKQQFEDEVSTPSDVSERAEDAELFEETEIASTATALNISERNQAGNSNKSSQKGVSRSRKDLAELKVQFVGIVEEDRSEQTNNEDANNEMPPTAEDDSSNDKKAA